MQHSRIPSDLPLLLALALVTLGAPACNPHSIEKAMMLTAYRPDLGAEHRAAPPPYQLLAGDMHCHVSPPDAPSDVLRDLPETFALARDEGLDFVVLTPHLGARFFADPAQRAFAAEGHAELRRALAAAGPQSAIFVPGFEYTDYRFGHVSASFADLGKVLAEVPLDVAQADPARFFERWVGAGGLLVVNHPVVTPLDSNFAAARADMSWRPWTKGPPFPPEIAAVHRLAIGFEAYNAAVARMRDGFLVGDGTYGVREVMSRLDLEIQTQRRRIVPVGGSDSHTGYMRATVFVLAAERSEAGVRDAIVQGRTCVKSPDACSLEVRGPGGPWVGVGGTVRAAAEVLVRARGESISIHRDGGEVAAPASGVVARVPVVPGVCSLVRARVDAGYSAPVYVNCDFAERAPGSGT